MNKIHPSRLGFDFDGVVADIAEAFIRLSCEEYGHCSFTLEDITHFEVEQCLDIDQEIVAEVFDRILVDSVGIGLLPMPGALDVLAEMTRQAPVTVVTARPEPGPVHDWLEWVMPPDVRKMIRVVAMGDHDDKARYVIDHGLEFFIDDRAETCSQLDQAGINPIVFDQPWNRDRHSFSYVENWWQIRALCFEDVTFSGKGR